MEEDLIEVGEFGGEKVSYSKSTDILKCKNQAVFFGTIEKFIMEKSFRAWVNKETILMKSKDSYILGCLEDSNKNFDRLVKKIKNIKYGNS